MSGDVAVIEKNDAPNQWDQTFRCLSSEERRQLVFALEQVAADEWRALPQAAVSPNIEQDVSQLEIRLLHTHLPYLASRDYIEWQQDPFRLRQGPEFQALASVLSVLSDHPDQLPDELIHGCETVE